MSKSILKMQAKELLSKETRKITGGLDNERFAAGCRSCTSCTQACSPGGYSSKDLQTPTL